MSVLLHLITITAARKPPCIFEGRALLRLLHRGFFQQCSPSTFRLARRHSALRRNLPFSQLALLVIKPCLALLAAAPMLMLLEPPTTLLTHPCVSSSPLSVGPTSLKLARSTPLSHLFAPAVPPAAHSMTFHVALCFKSRSANGAGHEALASAISVEKSVPHTSLTFLSTDAGLDQFPPLSSLKPSTPSSVHLSLPSQHSATRTRSMLASSSTVAFTTKTPTASPQKSFLSPATSLILPLSSFVIRYLAEDSGAGY
ncbi:hypothetical protein HYPSUDRAFT_209505 [Hypholoma sublateritium FD-334 SS-4]|uniref:Uncharacterized protein n=1 Tax=Hypholoma sublateritium (strain FD-334 SS-4) TaxID=945553 RepID=A0A0D2NYD7_HYPSF|nr:hypothetical protein HYPSUDRAFT_209505 [Hypholoma sublateritium FD-334 SS-4]